MRYASVAQGRAATGLRLVLTADEQMRGGKAIALLVDNKSIQDHIYGRTGPATRNFLYGPARLTGSSSASVSR